MCVVVAMLFLNPLYACGADNRDLKEEVKAKQVEIDEFARQNKEMNGEYTELCMLSDCDSSSEPSDSDNSGLSLESGMSGAAKAWPTTDNIGALIVTYTILGAPHYNYRKIYPKRYSNYY